jgi:nitrite reductase/ring-hydroxylating ferredoxin subunit
LLRCGLVADLQKTSLCSFDHIPEGEARGFSLDKLGAIFGVRKDGQLYFYQNTCPHAGFELNWLPDRFLDPSRRYIQCTAHGALFDISGGTCIAGPCHGKALRAVPFDVEDGTIYLQLTKPGD